jgi:hypothetical protein
MEANGRSQLAFAKYPQMQVRNRIKDEITKNGRFPHSVPPEATKKVVTPAENARLPIITEDALFIETLY